MGSRHRPSSTQPRSVRARIERWRATRTKRSPMPEPLWDAAVELAQAEGIYPIARALAVNYQTLKCRVAMASNGNSRDPGGLRRADADAGERIGVAGRAGSRAVERGWGDADDSLALGA